MGDMMSIDIKTKSYLAIVGDEVEVLSYRFQEGGKLFLEVSKQNLVWLMRLLTNNGYSFSYRLIPSGHPENLVHTLVVEDKL